MYSGCSGIKPMCFTPSFYKFTHSHYKAGELDKYCPINLESHTNLLYMILLVSLTQHLTNSLVMMN